MRVTVYCCVDCGLCIVICSGRIDSPTPTSGSSTTNETKDNTIVNIVGLRFRLRDARKSPPPSTSLLLLFGVVPGPFLRHARRPDSKPFRQPPDCGGIPPTAFRSSLSQPSQTVMLLLWIDHRPERRLPGWWCRMRKRPQQQS